MDPRPIDEAMDLENKNDLHILYHAAVVLGDITNTDSHQRPFVNQPEPKRRRIQPTVTLQQYCPAPYTAPLFHPIPLAPQRNHALIPQDENTLPPNYCADPQSSPPHPSQEQSNKWKYLLDTRGTLGKISISETNPGKIPLFTTKSTKDHPSQRAKKFAKLKLSQEKDIDRKLFGFGDFVDVLSKKIKFAFTMDRRVNFQFGDLCYYIELELETRIYDLIINEDIKKKIAVIYYRIWNQSSDTCTNKSRLTNIRLFERQFVKYLLNNQHLMFSHEGHEELLRSIDSASEASQEKSATTFVKSHFILEDSGDTYWDLLRSPVWSLAVTDNRFDPEDSSLSFLISVENFNRELDVVPQKLLLLRSGEFGLNRDDTDYISGFIYLLFVTKKF